MMRSGDIEEQVIETIEDARAKKPLAGSITNYVTVDFVANAQLACGGSAAMVYLPDEAEALALIGEAFYINVGTLIPSHEEAMCHAASVLHDAGKPWVLDPVGIGLGKSRERILMHMKECVPSIVRCNASEAIALAELWGLDTNNATSSVKGVDSNDSIELARPAAVAIARFIGGAVAVSGSVDMVTDGEQVAYLEGGSPFMEKVTGFGCALGGVAAVHSACAEPFIAAVTASAMFDFAGRAAGEGCKGPASFKVAFIDGLFSARPEDAAAMLARVEEA